VHTTVICGLATLHLPDLMSYVPMLVRWPDLPLTGYIPESTWRKSALRFGQLLDHCLFHWHEHYAQASGLVYSVLHSFTSIRCMECIMVRRKRGEKWGIVSETFRFRTGTRILFGSTFGRVCRGVSGLDFRGDNGETICEKARPPSHRGGPIYRELSPMFYRTVHRTTAVHVSSNLEGYGSGGGPASSGMGGPSGMFRRYWQDTNRTSSQTWPSARKVSMSLIQRFCSFSRR
jgi:hypothetical protein